MARSVTVALIQQHSGQRPADLVQRAAGSGAEIVVFPEMYSNGYARFDRHDPAAEQRWRAGALSLDGAFLAGFRAAARASAVHVVATFLEAGDPDPFNAAVLIGPDGHTVLHHRKVHICDFDSPECACGRGNGFDVATIETNAGPVTVGMMICMDREFADAAARLSSAGAEIALVPNCCDLATDDAVGDVRVAQVRGRAFETVMGIAVANYPAPRCDGHSHAADAVGRVIGMAGIDPALLTATFDLDAIRAARAADRFRWQRQA